MVFCQSTTYEGCQKHNGTLKEVAQGAAMMTETTVDIEMGCGCCELSTNEAFADLAYANLIEADGPKYTKEELRFAKELQKTVEQGIIEKGKIFTKFMMKQ